MELLAEETDTITAIKSINEYIVMSSRYSLIKENCSQFAPEIVFWILELNSTHYLIVLNTIMWHL